MGIWECGEQKKSRRREETEQMGLLWLNIYMELKSNNICSENSRPCIDV